MQNLFAIFALLMWPLIAVWLYSALPIGRATIWTILGGQLLLPVGTIIKIPTIPQFDKGSIPSICIALGCMIVERRRLRIFARMGLLDLLIVLYLIVPLVTSELNGDAIILGQIILPGVGLYDAVSAVEASLISLFPFFVGRQFLWRSKNIEDMFRILAMAELFYTIPLLFEIRMSPQLHFWLYGYYPSDFIQSMRDGGFRPMAFMGHGLAAAFFLMMAIVASAALWRTRARLFSVASGAGITLYLSVVLIFCKSLGATVYAALLTPLVKLTSPRTQMFAAISIVLVAFLYPMLRSSNLFPTVGLLEIAHTVDPNREESLRVRFTNEDSLLAKALERPFFGWGRFGRNRVYNVESGKDESITDGRWVITLGQFGLFGFIAEFGLLTYGVFRAATTYRLAKTLDERLFLTSLSLIVAINILDLLPNSGLVPWTWLMAGSLVGRAEVLVELSGRRPAATTMPIKSTIVRPPINVPNS
jgi:hypothetical protein